MVLVDSCFLTGEDEILNISSETMACLPLDLMRMLRGAVNMMKEG